MKPVYVSGQWEIDLNRRELRSGGAAVPLGGKAFDMIAVLVSCSGALVTKDSLMRAVWPGAIVEDNTIQVHISAFRKALGPDRNLLRTASGRGYRLLGDWIAKPDTAAPPAATQVTAPGIPHGPQRRGNVPVPGSEPIGRALAVQHLRDLLSAYRAVTLTGPGGIGKTRLAQAVANNALSAPQTEVWLVELASLTDRGLVPSAVASALGVEVRGSAISREAVARAIGGRTMLLLLDNCEHVIDEAARLAETLLRSCPGVTLLATSREALGIEGEYAYRTAPLVVPPPDAPDLAAGSAVQLFLARARELSVDVPPETATLRAIAAICRRLDGIPLAIEFAAARAATLGIDQVLVRLDNRFALLTAGRRTALPRHQTLRATLDWSHDLLAESERVMLRRLSVFAGGFTLQAAAAVTGMSSTAVADGIASLVAKSLLGLEHAAAVSRWRLLETTRAYVQEKLLAAGESGETARRHATYFRDVLAPVGPRDTVRGDERDIDSIRLALDWSFSPVGDPRIGIGLTIGAVPLWVRLSLVAECRGRVERALASLGRDIEESPRARMQLNAALGWALMFAVGRGAGTNAAWSVTLALAEQLGDTSHRLRALWGLWVDSLNNGAFRRAAELAEAFAALVSESSDVIDQMMADRMMATSLHYLGDQNNARRLIDRMLGRPEQPAPDPQVLRFQFDQRVTAHYFQARIMWLQGYADQARRVVEANLLEAEPVGNALSLASVLGQGACMVALFSGDLAAAERYGTRLLEHAARHGLGLWEGWARGFNAAVRIRHGDIEGGLAGLRGELVAAAEARFLPRYMMLIGELAAGLGVAGEAALGLQTVDEAIERCEANGKLWFLPELLRIRGELIRQKRGDDVEAGALFGRAMDLADGQGALSWSLRAAVSLVRLRADWASVEQLRTIYGRFSEGFDTADLLAARRMVDAAR